MQQQAQLAPSMGFELSVTGACCRSRNGRHREAEQPRLLGRPAPLQLTGGPPKKAPGAFIAGFVPAKDVVRLPFYPPPTMPEGFVARHVFPPPPPPRPASGELTVSHHQRALYLFAESEDLYITT